MNNDFMRASKLKLRFKMSKGNVAVEDLWDLQTRDLEKILVEVHDLHQKHVSRSELSNVALPERAVSVSELKMRILKYIIDIKQGNPPPEAPEERTTRKYS